MATLLEAFKEQYPSARFVRLQWQDASGVLRARVVPIEQTVRLAGQGSRMQIAPCSLDLAVENSVLSAHTNYLGSDTACPDWSTIRTRTLLDPLYATVMCSIIRDQSPDSKRSNVCARRALQTVVTKAYQQFQMEFLIGFEVEFEIWKRNEHDELVLHSTGLGGAACSGLRHACYDCVEECMLILLEAGVGLEGMHTEGQQGQYEFNLAPKPPMEAVDELVLVHDTLKRVFARQGLIVTMFPRPTAHRPQSIGQHVHISIHNRPELEQSFLAGILHHLPSLIAFCLPYDISYERLKPGQGGTPTVAWGSQDRRVPVRKVKAGHWELRCVDATANMYLVLAVALSAGLCGCINRYVLQHPDTSPLDAIDINGNGALPIPSTFDAALNRLELDYNSDGGIRAIETFMESEAIRHYLEMKRFERLKLIELGEYKARSLLTELF